MELYITLALRILCICALYANTMLLRPLLELCWFLIFIIYIFGVLIAQSKLRGFMPKNTLKYVKMVLLINLKV